ncbi:hypothetical protein CVT25_003635 [Psilocybe cyanescens]|uniref:F-box domain-containing protein n=1 Tax=Psilocybe cyanescens TaxID=93625 RepID=A0A409WPC9_PSICY|nr:hypothetical protein CVT25_003635 [Psilocybe cyanescens]
MPCNIFQVPLEVFHRIALFATLASPLGPPKELLNCMLVCRTFWERLLPKNASQLYYVIFAQKFDARGPIYRLGKDIIHEHAPLEMRRRFDAIHIFKKRMFDHPGLTEALWIAYLMVEDSDTSQKNIKQLLRVGTPIFLDSYLRSRMYDGSVNNNGWPTIDENISLAIALSWTLASPRVMGSENPSLCAEMMRMLKPIVFASFRYSISCALPDSFTFAGTRQGPAASINMSNSPYPVSALPPQEIHYFGAVKRKARPPLAAIFATLLYFVRAETRTKNQTLPHVTCETRAEANQRGIQGPCAEDFRHYFNHCRTRFADFPGIDVGIQSSSIATNPDTVLCQPSFYKLGSLSGQWQGSFIMPGIYTPLADVGSPAMMVQYQDSQKPLYLTIEEHYCCDARAAAPVNLRRNGISNAWLPEDILAREHPDGMEFTDMKGTFRTTYTTHRRRDSESSPREQFPVADVIITAKTEDQYMAAWGGYTKIIGRVRLHDGLLALVQSNPDDQWTSGKIVLSGYVTSSQNLVGRICHYLNDGDAGLPFEGAFSLSKNHAGNSQFIHNKIHASLSIEANHHLYARIFCRKFDTAAPLARLGSDRLTSWALAHELRKRCITLQRLRARLDSTTQARRAEDDDTDSNKMSVHDVLFTAYIMMLENEERNKLQLVEYGRMKDWIREFWFDSHGASLAIYYIRIGKWPVNRPETALGMWLFWFLLNTDDYETSNNDGVESPMNVLKAMALGAHLYDLTSTSWVDFEPKPRRSLEDTILYAEPMDMVPPPLAAPAILSFLALVNKRRSIPLPPSDAPLPNQPFQEWDSEWGRCFTKSKRAITDCFRPGSIEGVWEGFFTYTEFTAYAAMLAGASPTVIQKGVVGRHQQTWKLREHHLLPFDHSDSDSGIDMDADSVTPLHAGDPLRSYFPIGTQIREHREGVTVQGSGSPHIRRYLRASALETQANREDRPPCVQDIIITGEGHSAWGQFNLVGRVRPCDGFISLSKDYVDGDRGKWLYRGYLVGNANGNLAGRWRDTLSPADVPGYEGCFVMSHRR